MSLEELDNLWQGVQNNATINLMRLMIEPDMIETVEELRPSRQ